MLVWPTNLFTKKQNITITENNNTILANYSVKVNVTYDSDMLPDFADLRFRDEDLSVELSYYIENYTTSINATVWVKMIENITASGFKNISMLYKNITPVNTTSSFNDAFLFADDFETNTSANWNYTGCVGAKMFISGGAMFVVDRSGGAGHTCSVSPKDLFQYHSINYEVSSMSEGNTTCHYLQTSAGYMSPTNRTTYYATKIGLPTADAQNSFIGVQSKGFDNPALIAHLFNNVSQNHNISVNYTTRIAFYGSKNMTFTRLANTGDPPGNGFLLQTVENDDFTSGFYGMGFYEGCGVIDYTTVIHWWKVRPIVESEPSVNFSTEFDLFDFGGPIQNSTLNITLFYSDWDYAFPNNINWLEFIPRTPTSKNVTPFGQTASRPILNITNYGYGGKNSTFSMNLNESYSCVNLSINTTSNKPSKEVSGDYSEFFDDFEIDFGHWDDNVGINCPDIDAWGRISNQTSSSNTGPQSEGVGGSGSNFTYVETSSGACVNIGAIALVTFNESINYDIFTDEKIQFYFHAYGTNIDDLYLEENSTGSWVKLWEMHDNNEDIWNMTNVSLSSLTGNGSLRFNYTRTSPGFTSDIALDNINVSYFTSSTLIPDTILNNTWTNITHNFDYLDLTQLWLWADYNCNSTTWRLWQPELSFRNCCEGCICSEELL